MLRRNLFGTRFASALIVVNLKYKPNNRNLHQRQKFILRKLQDHQEAAVTLAGFRSCTASATQSHSATGCKCHIIQTDIFEGTLQYPHQTDNNHLRLLSN